jgi:hypothetical protein
MNVSLSKGKAVSDKEIQLCEEALGHSLGAEFASFVKHNDGAHVSPNTFAGNANVGFGVSSFIPVSAIPNEVKNIEGIASGQYPIAWADGGNYVLLDSATGQTYFWDHELGANVYLSESFSEFLNKLTAFDLSTVVLDPAQVISAWIDPDFLKNQS